MNKKELFERISHLPSDCSGPLPMINKLAVLEFIKLLDEPQKPVVKQFVADWYEDIVDEFYVVLERLVLNYKNNTDMPICKWFFETEDALTILINMHQFGYTVEKEKRYLVKMKGMNKSSTILKLDEITGSWYLGEDAEYSYTKTAHTRKELEEAGFGEVFNSPLFEVEEVEGEM